MNAIVLPRRRRLAAAWRERARASLFLGALVVGLAAGLAIVLHLADPLHAALGATALALLLAVLS